MTTFFAPQCSLLVGNTGGNVQTLPPDYLITGKTRVWIEKIALNGQAPGDQIMIARLPYGATPVDLVYDSDTSLGAAATAAVGDKNNVSRFAAAGTFTATDTPTSKLRASAIGVPITTAYDYAGVNNTNYEDVLMTLGASSLPVGGTLTVLTYYQDYGV